MPYKTVISGIYKIQSRIKPEREYIGSAVNIYHRWISHKKDLRDGKHSSPSFLNHYKKYRLEDLEFSILAVCSRDDLIPIDGVVWLEQFFILAYKYKNTIKPYFNASPTAGSPLGTKYSKAIIKKLCKLRKGKGGHKMPDWFGSYMSERNKGNTYGKANLGKKRKPEDIEKVRLKLIGRRPSPQNTEAVIKANKRKALERKLQREMSIGKTLF